MRGGGKGDMPLAAEQARRGVEADPAGTRQVDLGPGMEIGEVRAGARRPVDGGGVGNELDQVAGDEARGEADAAQHLDQEPSGIAAGAALERQRLGRCLDTGLHADAVGDLGGDHGVEGHEEEHGVGLFRQPLEQGVDLGAHRVVGDEIRLQLRGQVALVSEGAGLGVILDEEIERVDDRHLGGQIDLDLQFGGPLGEDQTGEPVPVRVLLPVDEVVLRQDLEGIGRHGRARMRRGAQADHLRSELDRPIVLVVG